MTDDRGGPPARWLALLVIIAVVLGVIFGVWLFGVMT